MLCVLCVCVVSASTGECVLCVCVFVHVCECVCAYLCVYASRHDILGVGLGVCVC